jgi:hypothetical protein
LKEWNDERRKKERNRKKEKKLAEDLAIRDGNVAVITTQRRRERKENSDLNQIQP